MADAYTVEAALAANAWHVEYRKQNPATPWVFAVNDSSGREVATVNSEEDAKRIVSDHEYAPELALAKLRETFPLPYDLRISLSDHGRVITVEVYKDARLIAQGKTLADCMTQVKQWREGLS